MRAAPFQYRAPATVEDALALLAAPGGDARLLAGGQSLIPLMNLRLARPRLVVDINRVAGLSSLAEEGGRLRIGALVRHHTIEESPLIAARCPILAAAAAHIGDRQIRSRGTIGGSLAHADPAAELPTVVLALDGRIVARGPAGERVIAAADFFLGYMTTALAPGEILVEVRLPALGPATGWGFHEPEFKPAGFAVAACAALVTVDAKGTCTGARVALAAVAPTPVRVPPAEDLLTGRRLSHAAIEAAADVLYDAIDPEGDIHAPGPYRREMARLSARRALVQARERVPAGAARE